MFEWMTSRLSQRSALRARRVELRTRFAELALRTRDLEKEMDDELLDQPWRLLKRARLLEHELQNIRSNGEEELHDRWFPREQRTRLKVGSSIEKLRQFIIYATRAQVIEAQSATQRPLNLSKGDSRAVPTPSRYSPVSGVSALESYRSIDDLAFAPVGFAASQIDNYAQSSADSSPSSCSDSSSSDSGSFGGSCD